MTGRLRNTAPRGDSGASSVEYGLIVFGIAVTMVVALFALGEPVFGLFDSSCDTLKAGVAGGVAQTC